MHICIFLPPKLGFKSETLRFRWIVRVRFDSCIMVLLFPCLCLVLLFVCCFVSPLEFMFFYLVMEKKWSEVLNQTFERVGCGCSLQNSGCGDMITNENDHHCHSQELCILRGVPGAPCTGGASHFKLTFAFFISLPSGEKKLRLHLMSIWLVNRYLILQNRHLHWRP